MFHRTVETVSVLHRTEGTVSVLHRTGGTVSVYHSNRASILGRGSPAMPWSGEESSKGRGWRVA